MFCLADCVGGVQERRQRLQLVLEKGTRTHTAIPSQMLDWHGTRLVISSLSYIHAFLISATLLRASPEAILCGGRAPKPHLWLPCFSPQGSNRLKLAKSTAECLGSNSRPSNPPLTSHYPSKHTATCRSAALLGAADACWLRKS